MYPPSPLLRACESCKLSRNLTECGLQAARREGDSVLALHLFDVGEGLVKKLVSLVPWTQARDLPSGSCSVYARSRESKYDGQRMSRA
jgi:hypothetical protein